MGGYISNMKMGYCKVLLKTQDGLLQTIEHELKSTGLKLVPFLATRLLYQEGGTSELGMSECKCQSDLTPDCTCQEDLM